MNLLRMRPFTTAFTIVCWVVVIAQAAVWWVWQADAAELEQAVDRFAQASTLPETPLSEVDVLDALVAQDAELRRRLWPFDSERPEPPPPVDRSAAFLDLLRYRQEMKALADAEGIACDEAGFGFRDYANSGPEPEDRAHVHCQRGAAERLLRLLFAAKPTHWFGLRRDAPPSLRARSARGRADAPIDLFDPPPELLPAELARRICLELRFSGNTAVLRRFLNAVATGADCVLVRQVSVSPVGPTSGTFAEPGLVSQETEFRVVVDWLEPAT